MTDLLRDVRYTLRSLRRTSVTSVIVVASLAIGIAANTTVFSFVNAIQFKPLPVGDEATLVDLSETSATELCAGCAVGTSYPGFLDWAGRLQSLEAVGAYREERLVIGGDPAPERLTGAAVSGGLFSMIGVRPALGREVLVLDDQAGAAPVALISDRLWERRLGRAPGVLGETIRIDGVAHEIVGVMPPGFRFPEFADLWVALAPRSAEWKRDDRSLEVIGRMRTPADLDLVRAELRTIAAALAQAYPETNRGWTATAVSLRDDMTGETTMASMVLLGAVAFVLLIACANVANLLLVRALVRRRDSAIRLALGAGRARIARHVLLESLVLSACGGAIGLVAALWTSRLLVAAFRVDAPYWIQFGIDWRVFLFSGVITSLTALGCGIVPAWQASRRDVISALKHGGGAVGSHGRRFRAALAAGQLALALVLLAAAGLLIKTVISTFSVDPGYDTSRVLAGDLHLQDRRYENPAARRAFATAVLERVNGIPGVSGAVVNTIFFRGFGAEPQQMAAEGLPSMPAGASPSFYYAATPQYLPITGVAVVSGRAFTGSEADVVVVNEEMARRIWTGGSPLGQRIRFGDNEPWLTVVGVAREADARSRRRPSAWVPLDTQPGRALALYARTPGPGMDFAADLRAIVAGIDADMPIEDLMTMERRQAAWAAPARFVAILMASLAAVAVVLAAMGTYGVIAYAIQQRTREIGVRLALGATPSRMQRLMMGSGARLVGAGAGIGLGGAWASTRMLQGILAGTSPTDPGVFAAVTATLAAIGVLASWLPARRAARIDPMLVLRSE